MMPVRCDLCRNVHSFQQIGVDFFGLAEKAGTGQRGVKPLKYFNKLRGKFFISPSRSCSRLSVGVEAEEHQNAVYHAPRPRPGIAHRTSTDWNERNGDHRRCRSRQPRGAPSLHAGCDAALFGVHFGCVANHEMHDGKASAVESGMPGGDGTRDFPPRVSALLSALVWGDRSQVGISHPSPCSILSRLSPRPDLPLIGRCAQRRSRVAAGHREATLRLTVASAAARSMIRRAFQQCRTTNPRGVRLQARGSRHKLVFGRSLWIGTMMQSCASAAKLRGGGPILQNGGSTMCHCGSPPPRIVNGSTRDGLPS